METTRRVSARREQTEAAILAALGAQIAEDGMGKVGINAIAKRAGVSKELIYRYFGGISGLMLAWMKEQDFWTGKAALLTVDTQGSPSEQIASMLRSQIRALAENEALREIRRWELIERTEVSAALAKRREDAALVFAEHISRQVQDVDVQAQLGLLLGGVLYLMLRAKTESHFIGVPLRSDEGWQRLFAALERMVAQSFPPAEASSA